MDDSYTLRRLLYALVAAVVVLAIGTVGFAALLEDDAEDALYRSVVTASLTGLDNRPSGTGAELLTIFLVLSGLTIFAFIASILVEVVARGVITGAWAERPEEADHRAVARPLHHLRLRPSGTPGRTGVRRSRRAVRRSRLQRGGDR